MIQQPLIQGADKFAAQLVKQIRSDDTSLEVLRRLYSQSNTFYNQFQAEQETVSTLSCLDNLADQQSRLLRLAASLPARDIESLYAKAFMWRHEAPEINCTIDDMTDADALAYSLYRDLRTLHTAA